MDVSIKTVLKLYPVVKYNNINVVTTNMTGIPGIPARNNVE